MLHVKGASRFEVQLRWLHKVRLYPTCTQRDSFFEMLRQTRYLYNALLQQRRDLWRDKKFAIPSKHQYAEITDLRAEDPESAAIYRECQDATLRRLDLAFAAFFRRLKSRETPGYPRFKNASRWNQLEFPHGDRAVILDGLHKRVKIPGVGLVKFRKGRDVPDNYGRVFLVTKNGRWYAVFEAHRRPEPQPTAGKSVGIDRGVRVLAALSDETTFENPKHAKTHEDLVAYHARKLDNLTVKDAAGRVRNRRDPRRIAAARRLARSREREANARHDWLHKVSRTIIDDYDTIALEDLTLRSMTKSAKGTAQYPGTNVRAKSGLNRALLDAGLGKLVTLNAKRQHGPFATSSASTPDIVRKRAHPVGMLQKRVGRVRGLLASSVSIETMPTSTPRRSSSCVLSQSL